MVNHAAFSCRNVGSANQITEELRSHDNHTQASSTPYNGDEEDNGEAIASATEKLGYSELRKNQELVVRHFLRERDVFVSLPTGSGKSLWHFAIVFFLQRRFLGVLLKRVMKLFGVTWAWKL